MRDDLFVQPDQWPFHNRPWRLTTGSGMCLVSWTRYYISRPLTFPWQYRYHGVPYRGSFGPPRVFWYCYYDLGSSPPALEVQLYIPLRNLFFLLAIPLALYICRFRNRWCRFPFGCCSKCGYDLRATPNRCPECGVLISDEGTR